MEVMMPGQSGSIRASLAPAAVGIDGQWRSVSLAAMPSEGQINDSLSIGATVSIETPRQ